MLIFFFDFSFGGIARFLKIDEDGQFFDGKYGLLEAESPVFLFFNGFENEFGFLGVVPKAVGIGKFFFCFYELILAINVKGTSSNHLSFFLRA